MDTILNQLLEKVAQKRTLMGEMMIVTRNQKDSLAEKNVEKFEQYIAVRQNIMNSIDDIDKYIAVLYNTLSEKYGIVKLEDISSHTVARDIISNTGVIKDYVMEMIAIDEENRKNGNTIMNELKQAIQGMNTNMKVSNAYGKNMSSLGVLNSKN